MFTGIVLERGIVRAAERRAGALRLVIGAEATVRGLRVGDSVAVNGVCLTAIEVGPGEFAAEAVPETLAKTNLGALGEGAAVHLEPALAAGAPMGGHYVQGHVDGTVTLAARGQDGEALETRFSASPALLEHVVPKGFVALDGVSLTVVAVDAGGFSVTLVPHTQGVVTFAHAPLGVSVNLEVDVMAKYVARAVAGHLREVKARLDALEAAIARDA